jgi:hypothetical protein
MPNNLLKAILFGVAFLVSKQSYCQVYCTGPGAIRGAPPAAKIQVPPAV